MMKINFIKIWCFSNHLLEAGVVTKFYTPRECSIETMKTSHSLEYINHIKNKTLDIKSQKKIGFPINDSVVKRSFVATGGTVLASKLALDSKLACNTAGGSHHATFDCGAGYCVFNDVAVAANYLKNKRLANKILIVDLDVHQEMEIQKYLKMTQMFLHLVCIALLTIQQKNQIVILTLN